MLPGISCDLSMDNLRLFYERASQTIGYRNNGKKELDTATIIFIQYCIDFQKPISNVILDEVFNFVSERGIGTITPDNSKEAVETRIFFKLIVDGDLGAIQKMLNKDNTLVLKKIYGQSCAHIAAIYKRTEMLKLFLNNAANFFKMDKFGYSPAYYSVLNVDVNSIKFLRDQGAIFEKFCEGNSVPPLNLVAQSGSLAALKVLLNCSRCSNRFSNELSRCDLVTGDKVIHAAVRSRNLEIVSYLVKLYPNMVLDMNTVTGDTPLHLAVEIGDLQIVQDLCETIKQECQRNGDCALCYTDNKGQTPIQVALKLNRTEIVNYFVEKFPHTKVQVTEYNRTALDETLTTTIKFLEVAPYSPVRDEDLL